MANRKISRQEKVFARAYVLNGFNSTQAYMVAYPKASSNTAHKNSYLLPRRPRVAEEVKEIIEEELGDLDALASKTLHKLSVIAFANKEDEDYNANSQLKALELLQKQLGTNVQRIDANVSGDKEIVINITSDNDDEA